MRNIHNITLRYLKSRAHKPWSASCELRRWNFRGWKCPIHCLHFTVWPLPNSQFWRLFASNSRFMRLFQAALDTCLDSPFFASLSVHGLHFTAYAPSIKHRGRHHSDDHAKLGKWIAMRKISDVHRWYSRCSDLCTKAATTTQHGDLWATCSSKSCQNLAQKGSRPNIGKRGSSRDMPENSALIIFFTMFGSPFSRS